MVSRFRLVLVVWAVLYVWFFSLSYSKQPQEVREALAYSGRGAVIPLTATVAYLVLAASFTAAIGLLAWQNWARRLFVFVLVMGIILRALRGVTVTPAFSGFLGAIFGVLTGVIVALIYTPPLASEFKRRNEHPVTEEQAPFSEPAAPDEELVTVLETNRAAQVPAVNGVEISAASSTRGSGVSAAGGVRVPRPEFSAADVRSMTGVEKIWRDKTDDEVAEAAWNLSEYVEEAARIIRAELQRRGLAEPETHPVPIPDRDTRCVFVASGLDEANQIVAFLEAAGIASALRGESTTKTHGITVDGLGRLEVLVRESDEEQARGLLTSADAGEFQLGENEDIES